MQKNPNVWSVETEKIAKNLTLRSVREMRLQCHSYTIHKADPQQLKPLHCTIKEGSKLFLLMHLKPEHHCCQGH